VFGLFAAQRLQKIREIILKNKSIEVTALSEMLKVSDVTVRKDLDKLEKEGLITKTHGGAILAEQGVPDEKSELEIESYGNKDNIARLAFTTLDSGDCIFLGAGSTCLTFAEKIVELRDITVVTNNINAINTLYSPLKRIHFIGGEINSNNGVLYSTGQKALDYLEEMYFNKAYISVDAADNAA